MKNLQLYFDRAMQEANTVAFLWPVILSSCFPWWLWTALTPARLQEGSYKDFFVQNGVFIVPVCALGSVWLCFVVFVMFKAMWEYDGTPSITSVDPPPADGAGPPDEGSVQ